VPGALLVPGHLVVHRLDAPDHLQRHGAHGSRKLPAGAACG
jgi:hypothetical protein